ncbi:GntR family transcriptional regulator (plasmid) [Streptomyces olivoreticuli]|uniref:GntR family transcriptional regulator n=1 Tax=Streptomyces olivoreticuli TaxID=68246 RepID=UPI0026583009|nr:GntR family transcriptional regulator [Streptomyces olivoreticuli]WKK27798.1 GntR family transcriptional regulator [Streptomyces olivoreticuli]
MSTKRPRATGNPPPTVENVAAALRQRILAGEFRPEGEEPAYLPSARELSEQYGLSRQAIGRVIGTLKSEGLIVSRPGVAAYVRRVEPVEFPMHRFERGERRDDQKRGADDWKIAIEEQGRTPSQDTPQVTVERAPDDVATALRLEPRAFAVVRRRVRRVDGEEWQLSDSWFPSAVAMDTPLMEERDVTMPGGVLANIHDGRYRQRRLRDEIRSWSLTPQEKQRLGLDADVSIPTTRHTRIGYNAEGMPVRCMVTIAPGDRNVLVYELEV